MILLNAPQSPKRQGIITFVGNAVLQESLLPVPSMIARVTAKPGRIILPDVRCDIVWDGASLSLAGPMTTARTASLTGGPKIIFSFNPLLACAFLGVPLMTVTDLVLPLEDVAPGLAKCAMDALQTRSMGKPDHRIFSTARFPLRLDGRLFFLVQAIARGVSIRNAAQNVALSPRQVERLFLANLGMSPRHFYKIVRLRRAASGVRRGKSLSDAAMSAGYYDQSHFNRDAVALTGRSPVLLLGNVANVQDVLFGSLVD